MPELETPVAPAAPPLGGIASMVEQKFAPPAEKPTETTAAPPETPKPAETPAAPEVKPEAKPEAKAPEAPKAKSEFTDAEIEDGLKKHGDVHGWKVVKFLKQKFGTSEAAWKEEKAKLEARSQTPANDERIAQLEKLIESERKEKQEWQQRTEEKDYTRSKDYRDRFSIPYNEELSLLAQEVNSMGIIVKDEATGETRIRAATQDDLDDLTNPRLSPKNQDKLAKEMFGDSHYRITESLKELNRIRLRADSATKEHAANFEKIKAERELEAKRQRDEYEKALAEAHSGFQKDPELGKYLTEAETDPEGTKLFKTALEKYDSFRTVQPTAADVAEVRASYAMKPRLLHENKQLSAKVASLEAELAKLRGADPGQTVKTVTGSNATPPPKGIDGLLAAQKWTA